MARPKKIVDPVEVEKLAAMGCTTDEIAAFFDCSRDTIERRFAAKIRKGKERGRTRLRRLQWQAAEKGNATLMIWLGKQYLGQTDKIDQKLEAAADIKASVTYDTEWGGNNEPKGPGESDS
jgi:hypothetical protein